MSIVENQHRAPEPRLNSTCADEELVRLLVAGNHDAMRIIFDRYYSIMMRIALRIVRDPGEAERVVSVAFTDFYRKAELFDPGNRSPRVTLSAHPQTLNNGCSVCNTGFRRGICLKRPTLVTTR